MRKLPEHIHSTVEKYLNSTEIARGYDDYFALNNLFEFDCKFIKSELTAPGRVLDAGCGSGRHLLFLERNGFEAHGLDLSRDFLQVAREKLISHNITPRLYHGDIMNPPLDKSEKFDAIILMFSVLGMIKGQANRITALHNLKAYLKDKGKIILHTHNRNFGSNRLISRLKNMRKKQLDDERGLEEGDFIMKGYRGLQNLYLHSFCIDEIHQLLRAANLEISRIIPLNRQRNGKCPHPNINRRANGFLISAIDSGK